jgi:F0F1-type ATP synthase assembly protein I
VADVAAAWLIKPPPGSAVRLLHLLTWLIVTISFIVASAVFRTGVSAMFGDFLALLVAGALAIRWAGRHAAQDVSSRIS